MCTGDTDGPVTALPVSYHMLGARWAHKHCCRKHLTFQPWWSMHSQRTQHTCTTRQLSLTHNKATTDSVPLQAGMPGCKTTQQQARDGRSRHCSTQRSARGLRQPHLQHSALSPRLRQLHPQDEVVVAIPAPKRMHLTCWQLPGPHLDVNPARCKVLAHVSASFAWHCQTTFVATEASYTRIEKPERVH